MKQCKIDQAREFGEEYLSELEKIISKKRKFSKKVIAGYINEGHLGLESALSVLESNRFDSLSKKEIENKVAATIRRYASYYAVEHQIRHHQKFPRESTGEFKERLSEENQNLVLKIANNISNSTGVDREELIGHGMVGLWKAINSYKQDKKVQFSTYAYKCIQNEMLGMMRKENNVAKNNVSLGAVVSRDKDGKEMELGTSVALGHESEIVPEKLEAKKDFNQTIKELMDDELSPVEKHVAMHRFELYGAKIRTQMELAEELNISQASISKMEKDVLAKLKKIVIDHADDLGIENSSRYKAAIKTLFEEGWFNDGEDEESEDLMDVGEFVSIDELETY